MRTYHLKSWKIVVDNRSKKMYDIVCDEKNFMILNPYQEYIVFIEVNQKDNLVLQKLSDFIQYQFSASEKCLNMIIL